MIQNQTKISIKDNSGLLLGRCINAGKQGVVPTLGQRVKVTVLKSKAITKRKGSKRGALQDLLLVQTKKSICRNDGSTLKFNGNKGVCVSGSGTKFQYGFKRINTAVTVELKKSLGQYGGYGTNIMKLAKNIL